MLASVIGPALSIAARLSPEEEVVLAAFRFYGEGAEFKDIVRFTGLPKDAIAKVIADLEDSGKIEFGDGPTPSTKVITVEDLLQD